MNAAELEVLRNQTGGKRKRGKKDDPEYIPRSPNAFICFRRLMIAKGYVSVELANDERTLSKICSAMWKGLGEEAKQKFRDIADQLARDHAIKYPNYKYQPAKKGEKKATAGSKAGKANKASATKARPTKVARSASPERVSSKVTTVKRNHRAEPYGKPLIQLSSKDAQSAAQVDMQATDVAHLILTKGLTGDALTEAFKETRAARPPPAPTVTTIPVQPYAPQPQRRIALIQDTPSPVSSGAAASPAASLALSDREALDLATPVPDIPDRRHSRTAHDEFSPRRSSSTWAHADQRQFFTYAPISLTVRGLALDAVNGRSDASISASGVGEATGSSDSDRSFATSTSTTGSARAPAPVPMADAGTLFGDFLRRPFDGSASDPAQPPVAHANVCVALVPVRTLRSPDCSQDVTPPARVPTAPFSFSQHVAPSQSLNFTLDSRVAAAASVPLPFSQTGSSYNVTPTPYDILGIPVDSSQPSTSMPIMASTSGSENRDWAMDLTRQSSPPPLIAHTHAEYLQTVPATLQLEMGMYGLHSAMDTVSMDPQSASSPFDGYTRPQSSTNQFASGSNFVDGMSSPPYESYSTPTYQSSASQFSSTPISPTFPNNVPFRNSSAAEASTPISPTFPFSGAPLSPTNGYYDQTAYVTAATSPYNAPGTPVSPGPATGDGSPHSLDVHAFATQQSQVESSAFKQQQQQQQPMYDQQALYGQQQQAFVGVQQQQQQAYPAASYPAQQSFVQDQAVYYGQSLQRQAEPQLEYSLSAPVQVYSAGAAAAISTGLVSAAEVDLLVGELVRQKQAQAQQQQQQQPHQTSYEAYHQPQQHQQPRQQQQMALGQQSSLQGWGFAA